MNTSNYGRTRCRHTFTNGTQCGSPALNGENLCYYHHETRKPIANPQDRTARRNTFDLPAPTNPENIQNGLSEVFFRIASNQIDPRRAGLLLYCLQIATANLKAKTQPKAVDKPRGGSTGLQTRESATTYEWASAPGLLPEAPTYQFPAASTINPTNDQRTTDNEQPTTAEGKEMRVEIETNPDPANSKSILHLPEDPVRGKPIRRAVFGVLLESLARHHGINVEDPKYQNHHEESAILAQLRATADDDSQQRTTNNQQQRPRR